MFDGRNPEDVEWMIDDWRTGVEAAVTDHVRDRVTEAVTEAAVTEAGVPGG